MKILEKLYPLSTNNMVVKKNTCFTHLLCFLPHNYLQYFLNSGDSNSRKNPQLNVKGTVGVLTVQALRADWLPGCCDGLSHQQCLKCISFVPIFSLLFKISTCDSDILLNVFGKCLEDFPVYHFVKIFILSFDVTNLNFCYMNLAKKYVYYEICILKTKRHFTPGNIVLVMSIFNNQELI